MPVAVMPVVAHASKNRFRRGRLVVGLLLVAAGFALVWRVVDVSQGWATVTLNTIALQMPSGVLPGRVNLPAIAPGAALLLIGLAFVWANLQTDRDPSDEIDVEPIAQWVRAFERHQAEQRMFRGRLLQETRQVRMVKVQSNGAAPHRS